MRIRLFERTDSISTRAQENHTVGKDRVDSKNKQCAPSYEGVRELPLGEIGKAVDNVKRDARERRQVKKTLKRIVLEGTNYCRSRRQQTFGNESRSGKYAETLTSQWHQPGKSSIKQNGFKKPRSVEVVCTTL